MIVSFNCKLRLGVTHKDLEDLFYDGTVKGIHAERTAKLATCEDRLDAATNPQDINIPNYKLHPLKGKLQGSWSIKVSGAWGLTFEFDGIDAIVVDYEQYP